MRSPRIRILVEQGHDGPDGSLEYIVSSVPHRTLEFSLHPCLNPAQRDLHRDASPVTALFNLTRVAMNDADLTVGCLVLGVAMMFELWRSPKRWVTFREKRAKFRPRQTPFELHLDRLHLGEHQWTWDAVEAIECDQEFPNCFWVRPRTGERRGFRAKQASPEQVSTLVAMMEAWRLRFGTAESLPDSLQELRGRGQE